MGIDSVAIYCDVTDRAGVKEAYAKLADYFGGRLDVQVNNAGVFIRERLEDSTDEVTDKIIDVNLRGTLNTSSAAIPLLKETVEKNGITCSIINAHSLLGQFPDFGLGVYCASKSAVQTLTRVMASECAPYGIRVNGYAPALTDTPMVHHVITERWESKQDQISMRDWGRPIQIAKICWFFATDLSEYTTGASVSSDGGAWAVQRPFEAWKAAGKL